MAKQARVLLVDDDPQARWALRKALASRRPSVRVAEAPDLPTAHRMLAACAMDCIVLRLDLGGGNGLQLAQEILAQGDPPALVGLSRAPDATACHRLFRLGAEDVLDTRRESPEAIRWAVHHALNRSHRRHGPSPAHRLPAVLPPPSARVRMVRRAVTHAETGRVEGWELHARLGTDPLLAQLLSARATGTLAALELRLLRARLVAVRTLPRTDRVWLPVLASTLHNTAARRVLIDTARRQPPGRLVAVAWSLLSDVDDLTAPAMALRTAGVALGVARLGRGPLAMELVLSLRPSQLRLDGQLIARCASDTRSRATIAQLAHLGRSIGASVAAPCPTGRE